MGNEMHVIENEFLKVAVAPHGAELCSIYDKVRQHEVVWQADPAYWNRHAPVLFPFVGKVNEGTYRYKRQRIQLHSVCATMKRAGQSILSPLN